MIVADCLLEASWWQVPGLLGALDVFKRKDYSWQVVTGTGAGAIVAALIAAGYTQSEITQELEGFVEKIQDSRHRLTKIPLIGWLASLFWSGNLMKADTLEEWMRNLLAQKGISTFSDLIVTNDDAEPNSKSVKLHLVHRRHMIRLPEDIVDYEGYDDPMQLEVAFAVRMAVTTPLMIAPVTLKCKESFFPEEVPIPPKSFWQYLINTLWPYPKERDCSIVEGRLFRDHPVLPLVPTRKQVPSFGLRVRNAFPFDQPTRITNPLLMAISYALTRHVEQAHVDATQRFKAIDIQGAPYYDEPQWFLQYAFGIDAALKHFTTKPKRMYVPPHARGRDYVAYK